MFSDANDVAFDKWTDTSVLRLHLMQILEKLSFYSIDFLELVDCVRSLKTYVFELLC